MLTLIVAVGMGVLEAWLAAAPKPPPPPPPMGGAVAKEAPKDAPKDSPKSAAPDPLELSDALKEIQGQIDDNMTEGLLLPREKATALMAQLTDLRNKFPLEGMSETNKLRWFRAATTCQLFLGRAKESAALAAQWTDLQPKEPLAWGAAYNASLATGDKAAVRKSLPNMLRSAGTLLLKVGQPRYDLSKMSREEIDRLLDSTEQRDQREIYVNNRLAMMEPVGKRVPLISLIDPKTGKKLLSWKAEPSGSVVVVIGWNRQSPEGSQEAVLEAYRKLHAVLGTNERVTFLSINLLERPADRAAERQAMEAAMLPGFNHQENAGGPGLFATKLEARRYPTLIVIGSDGTVRFGGQPSASLAREALAAILAVLSDSESAPAEATKKDAKKPRDK